MSFDEYEHFANILLNWNWSNIITIFANIVLSFLTYLLFRETKKTRLENQSSEIIVGFEMNHRIFNAIDLVVENVGNGVAKNIKLILPEEINIELKPTNPNHTLNQMAIFKKTIPHLKSKQQIRSFAFMSFDLENFDKSSFKVVAEWENYDKKRQNSEILVDMSYLNGIGKLGGDPITEIAKYQKEISHDIKKVISSGIGGNMIKVQTTTKSELKAEYDEWREQNNKK